MTLDLPSIIFYLFATLTLCSAAAVISLRNPVHAVLSLIFCFFNAAGLFVLLGAEYLAMTLVIVYVGAVAILFLFVVMMLDVKYASLKEGFARYLPFGLLLAAILMAEFFLLLQAGLQRGGQAVATLPIPAPEEMSNAHAIGQVLYTDYAYIFQLAGLVLLVAMIGAIVLTLRHRDGVRRQTISEQVKRTGKDGLRMVDVEIGKGV